jgi:hypothetical protein
LSDLVRGPLDALSRLSGIDRAAQSVERLGRAAERAARLLDRLDADRLERLVEAAERAAVMLDRLERDLGIEGITRTLGEIETLSRTTKEMNQSLKAIERFLVDTRAVLEPLDRLPIPRALRRPRRSDDPKAP